MEQKVVLHLKDGNVHKGVTQDFEPEEPTFHLLPAEGGGVPMRVSVVDMKALFYVKDYLGNREFVAKKRFGMTRTPGRKAIVTFFDEEVVYGLVNPEDEGRKGFFMEPVDPDDNNVRIYVVRASVRSIEFPA